MIFTPVTGAAEEEAVIEIKPPVEEAVLVVKKGPLVGQRFALTRGTITLGRDPGSDIFLNDITVSRKHAKVDFDPPHFVIRDVGSLNGTYINGKRVEKSTLSQGDELQIGKFKLIFLSREG
jgi:pSer/pThr/pTyr-binding forkhead associated (FHA) protein